MAEPLRIIVLEGDETGQELLEQAVRVLDPGVTRVEAGLEHYDLSLENRRTTNNEVVTAAAKALARGPLRPQGRHDHAGGQGRRRQPQPHPARGARRQGDHPHGPAHPRRHAGGRRALSDRGRAHGGRRRLRRRAVAGERGRRRVRLPHRADLAQRLPRGGRVLVPHGGQDPRPRVRRPQVDREPGLRGPPEGGDGRGRGAPPRGALQPGPDRRDLRGPDHRSRRRPARDPRPEPRRRLPVGPRAAAVRLDRGRRVRAAGARRRLRAHAP